MGKNNNGLVYCRLINTTVLYLLTTMLNFLYSTPDILWHTKVFVFDPPMQSTINISYNTCTCALPDLYVLALGRCVPSSIVHIVGIDQEYMASHVSEKQLYNHISFKYCMAIYVLVQSY